jgi:hypothetical protein
VRNVFACIYKWIDRGGNRDGDPMHTHSHTHTHTHTHVWFSRYMMCVCVCVCVYAGKWRVLEYFLKRWQYEKGFPSREVDMKHTHTRIHSRTQISWRCEHRRRPRVQQRDHRHHRPLPHPSRQDRPHLLLHGIIQERANLQPQIPEHQLDL